MKNVIILHGTCSTKEYYSDEFPSLSNSHWFPWLQKQLLIKDIMCYTPEMFQAFDPNYLLWKKEFEKYKITEETILVGHSCGGGFLVRWLSENKDIKLKGVILVAPWLDPENVKQNDFFNFSIDPFIINRAENFILFTSDNDDEDILESCKIIKNKITHLEIKTFHNYGHFCYSDLKTDAFPELLNQILYYYNL